MPQAAEAQTRIAFLTAELTRHNHLYYAEAQPEISDSEFDALMRELDSLEKEFPQFRAAESPTQRVGGEITKVFPTFEHKKPMRSLENAYSAEEMADFHDRILKGLLHDRFDYLTQLKIDGVAMSLHYENGVLTHAVTRGNGAAGDLITANVRTIRSVPLKAHGANLPAKFEVRGEVYISRADFDAWNEERQAAGEPTLANPRNATAGALKLQDSREVAKRPLAFIAYYLDAEAATPATDWECMAALKQWGFPVSPYNQLCATLDDVMAFINRWETKRDTIAYETDGVVVKLNQLDYREELGMRSKSPRWAVAYKYAAEQAETTLNTVEFQVGRTGYITPVANLEPVALAGTTVKRASLYNFDEIRRLDLHLGDRLVIEKSGEIIPKVIKVNLEKRANGLSPVEVPSNCPACGTKLIQPEGEVGSYCSNADGCPPQLKARIEHFATKKAMNVDGLGTELVAQLVDVGLIRDFTDLFDLKLDDLVKLERFGKKSAENLLKGLESAKSVPFQRVLYAIGIRYVGEGTSQKLATHFRNIDALAAADAETIANVYEIGDKTAQSVAAFFANPENRARIDRLKAAGLQFVMEDKQPQSDKLGGKRFLASGSFEGYGRDDIKDLITANGGVYVGSISKNLDYLVVGEKMGPAKKEKAEQLKITMIGIDELLAMLGD